MDKKQHEVLTAVNDKLQEMEIPLVTLEILNWRMPKAMADLRRTIGKYTYSNR
jgi:hypothetical protein